MTATEQTHKPCPYVECSSSDAFSFNPSKGVGYCHSCGDTYPRSKHHQTKASWAAEEYPVSEEKLVKFEPPKAFTPTVSRHESIRDIEEGVIEKYGITVDYDSTGKAVRHTYPYPHKEKYRYLPKDFSKNLGFKNSHLFGRDKFNSGSAKWITVVEGELDAPAAYQMLGKKWPVVSVPSATLAKNFFEINYEYLDGFEEIILAVDGDAAGDGLATQFFNTFPNKVSRVSMTKHKDACEFLMNGHEREFMFAWHNRVKYVPPGIYNTVEQFKDILNAEENMEFLPTRISAFNDICKGIMRGHLTIFTGQEGLGKTEVLRMLEYDILNNHKDTPIAVLHMEESKKTCLMSYASYKLGVNLRDPEHGVPQADIDEAIESLTKDGNLYLFELSIDEDPLTILEKVRYFTGACGCKYIFIDPIQQLSYGKDYDMSEENMLTRISVQLEKLATEFNVGIICTTHVNDDGKTRSSRMIGKSASVRVDLQREHMSTDPIEANTTTLWVTKNRPIGPTGFGGQVIFKPESFTLEETHGDVPD